MSGTGAQGIEVARLSEGFVMGSIERNSHVIIHTADGFQ